MTIAMREAEAAFEKKEIPVGAIIVRDNAIIGRGHNLVETMHDPTAHAEIIAITAAADHLGSKWLKGCSLYVTLEPCPMCAGAIVLARIPRLVFGSYDPKMGACGTLYSITEDKRLNHRVHVIGGVMDSESSSMLKEFFTLQRNRPVKN
jgi:tRNA(adenine34) deaminase